MLSRGDAARLRLLLMMERGERKTACCMLRVDGKGAQYPRTRPIVGRRPRGTGAQRVHQGCMRGRSVVAGDRDGMGGESGGGGCVWHTLDRESEAAGGGGGERKEIGAGRTGVGAVVVEDGWQGTHGRDSQRMENAAGCCRRHRANGKGNRGAQFALTLMSARGRVKKIHAGVGRLENASPLVSMVSMGGPTSGQASRTPRQKRQQHTLQT